MFTYILSCELKLIVCYKALFENKNIKDFHFQENIHRENQR